MAAVIVIECPKCGKQLKAPPELQGKKIRCKDCGTAFPVQAKSEAKGEEKKAETFAFKEDDGPKAPPKKPAPPPKAPPKKPVDDDDEEGSNPYGVTDEKLIARCPNCAKEMDSEDAIICLHCGYNTRSRRRAETKRVLEITSQDRIQWMMPAVACIIGILVLVGLNVFLWFGLQGMWQTWDEATTPSLSRGLRTWISAFSLWGCYAAGKFAFRRLVLQPAPPEEEIK